MNSEEIIIDNNIVKIDIIESQGKVFFYTKNGVQYEGDLEEILHTRRKIYNDFNVGKKCKELTTSFFRRKKLERMINPIIIAVLNENDEIYEYIKSIKSGKQLPFILEHDRRDSTLGFWKRRIMQRVAQYEEKLGIIVKKDKSRLEIIKEKEEQEKTERIEIEKIYNNTLNLLKNVAENGIYYGSNELDIIEKNIEHCALWYLKKRDYHEASTCINKLEELIENEKLKYYYPIAEDELKKGNLKICEKLIREYLLKRCKVDKLMIKNEYLNGDTAYAKELYIKLLSRLGISLTRQELNKSVPKGMVIGSYYKQDELTGIFEKTKLVGDEKLKQIIDTEKQKMIADSQKFEVEEDNKKVSKEEVNNIIQKYMKMGDVIKYQKGMIIPVINNIICYLKEHDDKEVQEFLNAILSDFENTSAIELLRQNVGRNKKYSTLIFDYISNLYKDGVEIDGRKIFQKNEDRYSYYMYILNRKLNENIEDSSSISEKRKREIQDYYNSNCENIERGYFEILKTQNAINKQSLFERLKASINYSKAIQDLSISTKSDYIKLLTIGEDLKNGVYRQTMGRYTNKREFYSLFNTMIEKLDNGEEISEIALEDLGNIAYEGIKDNFGNTVIEPNLDIAKRFYLQLRNNNNDLNDIVYGRLISIYKSELNPITDIREIRRLNKIVKSKGLKVEDQAINDEQRGEEYVCSDLHGQYEVYKSMIDSIKENDKLYILGDVIDRGPDGIKILQDIADRQESGQVELFLGNHEYMMLQSLFLEDESVKKIWTSENNGGNKTKQDFDQLSIEDKNRIIELLLNSLVYKEIECNNERIHLVHAKAIQDSDKTKATVRDFLKSGRQKDIEMAVWTRKGDVKTDGEVWKEEEIGKNNMFTIIGHTPTNGTIDISNGYVNIDCGASYFSNGCLMRISDGKVIYFDNFERCNQQMKDIQEETR